MNKAVSVNLATQPYVSSLVNSDWLAELRYRTSIVDLQPLLRMFSESQTTYFLSKTRLISTKYPNLEWNQLSHSMKLRIHHLKSNHACIFPGSQGRTPGMDHEAANVLCRFRTIDWKAC
jgi:hypothetical protein